MGIADSKGVIYDFQAPYTVGADHMAFGRPTRYVQLDPQRVADASAGNGDVVAAWDAAVRRGAEIYSRRMHNLWWVGLAARAARAARGRRRSRSARRLAAATTATRTWRRR